MGIVQADSPGLASLIDTRRGAVSLGSGYQFTEGPVWSAGRGCLYFSDIPGDTRWRWSEAPGMEVACARPSRRTAWRSTSRAT